MFAELEASGHLPKELRERPETSGEVEWLLAAFNELCTCRAFLPGGAGPIPWTSIVHYATHHGLDRSNTQLLIAVIREMDAEWLLSEQKRLDEEARRNRAPAPGADDDGR